MISKALPRLALGACVLLGTAQAQSVPRVSRIEQARQFTKPGAANSPERGPEATTLPAGDLLLTQDDAFGTQQILKREEKIRPFSVFGEVAGFVTNNVALARRDRQDDSFLVATFGLSYRRAITSTLALEATARGAMFRYNEFSALDFQSIDAGGGLTWAPERLRGVVLYARYNFTDLIGARSGDTFFTNHTITLGAQRTWSLSRAQSLFAGASGQWAFADPEPAQRDEYSLYAGYQLQATRRLQAAVSYRYGYFIYREEGERKDHNQAASLSLRYDVSPWAAVTASTFFGVNRSNEEVFDYDVVNAGGGLGLTVQF